ncbi:MAG: hypothetical protein OHK0046_04150 [Anaerolineae bacterium]
MAEDIDKKAARDRKRSERDAAKAAKRTERDRKKADKENASTAQSSDEKPGGIVGWLVDSYNGIFRIVILPQLPKTRLTLLMLIALFFGLIWAYGVRTTQFYNGAPYQLSSDQRDQYIILVAGAHLGELYSDENIIELLSRVERPGDAVARLITTQSGQVQFALQEIQDLANQANPGTSAPSQGNILQSILDFVIAVIVFILVINIFAIAWGLLIGGYVERFLARFRPKTEADLEAERVRQDIERRKLLQAEMEAASKTQAAEFGPPLMQRVSPYTKGRAYDDSFAIEDSNDMFLGEAGATIAKTIGDAQDLAAIEIWLFDKDDFVKTFTKVLATPHAFNDPVIRAELEDKVDNPATDIVVLQPGAIATIESNNIRLQAKVADIRFSSDPALPPNSAVETMTLQMQAWEMKNAPVPATAPAPATASGLPDLASYEIGPPPQMPTQRPPAPGGLPDLSSYEIGPPPQMPAQQPPRYSPLPPAQPANPAPPQNPFASSGYGNVNRPPAPPPSFPGDDDEEDDPFGGTGDFTPINR